MRVVVLVKATDDSEQGRMAPPELLVAMGWNAYLHGMVHGFVASALDGAGYGPAH